jgi:hypothetical protein
MASKIHHTQKAQAAKIGVELRAEGNIVEAFWPERGATVLGATASEALEKMREVQAMTQESEANGEEMLDVDIKALMQEEPGPKDPDEEEESDEDEDGEAESDDQEEGDDNDAEEEKVSSSVVKEKYRAIYAERGHPAHCGDWLAEILNNLTLVGKKSDIQRFREICEMNDVDMGKYKTWGNGWQGRFRMTGRNLLAKKLFERDFLVAPGMNGEAEQYPVPQEWKDEQRFQRSDK